MEKIAFVLNETGNEWHHNVAKNYSQLNIDFIMSSRVNSGYDVSFFTTKEFSINNFTSFDIVVSFNAGYIIGWGFFVSKILKDVKHIKAGTIHIDNNFTIYKPSYSGEARYDKNIPYVSTESHSSFIDSHSHAIDNLLRDSNMSYIVHNEYPNFSSIKQKTSWAVTVSSGFFINMVMHNHGFDNDTKVYHIDVSKISLQARQYTIENWNGNDINNWIKHLYDVFPSIKLFNKRKYTKEDNDYLDVMNDVYEYFGDNWQSHWKQYQALDHSFEYLNISNNQHVNKFIKKLPQGNGLIWWNGALKRMPGNLLKTTDDSHRSAINFLESINSTDSNVICYGSDHCFQKYDGIYADQCVKQVKQYNSRDKLWQQI